MVTDAEVSQYLDMIAAADAREEVPEVVSARRVKTRKPARRYDKPVTPPLVIVDEDGEEEEFTDEQLLAEVGAVPSYSTIEAAQFFDKSNQWLYWGLRDKALGGEPITPIFLHKDGTPIVPDRVGSRPDAPRRFTLPVIREILMSSYRRGNVSTDELKRVLRRIRINERGGEWRDREGWHLIRGKWVHPGDAHKVRGRWVRRKKSEPPQEEE